MITIASSPGGPINLWGLRVRDRQGSPTTTPANLPTGYPPRHISVPMRNYRAFAGLCHRRPLAQCPHSVAELQSPSSGYLLRGGA
jgi:hypothetical protein